MKRLKGKYLQPVIDFVDRLDLESWYEYANERGSDQLAKTIAQLHKEYIDENHAGGLLLHALATFATEHAGPIGMFDLPPSENLKAKLVEHLTQAIESLPRKYTFRIQLPSCTYVGDYSIPISDRIRLAASERRFAGGNRPFLSGALSALITPSDVNVYLEIDVTGYGNESADSPATAEAISIAKQVAFILEVFNLSVRSFLGGRAGATITPGELTHDSPVSITDALARCYGTLSLQSVIWKKNSSGMSSVYLQPMPHPAEDIQVQSLISGLSPLCEFFAISEHPDFQSIAAAMEWYQDSAFADNQTIAYLSACIGLEALLGSDKQLDNMSKRLGDRFGFLLGKGRSDRERLSEEYRAVLDLRGKLVHARQARLSGDDQRLLRRAQSMLKDAIWHELHRMLRDGQQNTN